jgi:hypothetical protein
MEEECFLLIFSVIIYHTRKGKKWIINYRRRIDIEEQKCKNYFGENWNFCKSQNFVMYSIIWDISVRVNLENYKL